MPISSKLEPLKPLRRASLARRIRHRKRVSPRLRAELESDPPWMYPWPIAPGVTAPIHDDFLLGVHETRAEMIRGPVSEALAAAGTGATAIDLACNEGWFSHRLLDWGASRVVGVDIREVNIRRAKLVAAEYGIPAERLELIEADVFDLRPERLGTFDVVLVLGLIYHLENPVGAIRLARKLTRGVCVIEGQLTQLNEPIPWAGRKPDMPDRGSFATLTERDAADNPLASQDGLISLIPNAAAVIEMAEVAGFDSVEQVTPPPVSDPLYARGDRGVFIARVDPEGGA